MSESSKRDEWDQHNRDEAKQRALQQESAGAESRPVPAGPYAHLSGSPAGKGTELNVTGLIAEYERATAAERLAWLAARDLIAREIRAEAWNGWRDAVERTQEAARTLVNHDTGAEPDAN